MSVSASDITSRFTEFASVSSTIINLMIDDAELSVNRAVWGLKADLATIYLVAHLLTLAGQGTGGGSTGAVIEKKVGDLTKKFASPQMKSTDSGLGSTSYGRLFLRLRKEIVKSPMVVNFNQDYNT